MKLSIIGAGNVGATAAFIAALRSREIGIDEIVLVDIVPNVPQGKALDLNQCMAVFDINTKIIGSNSYEETENSDIVVITAGLPRKPGMSRDDLIGINAKIVKGVVESVMKHSKNPWLIIVTNPLDAMVFVAKETSGSEKVVGMAGTLDSARLRYFLSAELEEDVEKIEATTLGSHGDEMVPLMSIAKIEDKPASKFISDKKAKEIIERTRKGGAEIVNLLGTSAYYAPAAAIIEIIGAIDTEKVVPASVQYKDVFIGLPVKLKEGRVEIQQDILKNMNREEKEMFETSVNHVRELIEKTKEIIRK